jgi:RNA polymerase sigma factor (sigma-70 family)
VRDDRHAACLDAAKSGNRVALDTLVGELTPLVWHVARGQGLDRPAAEDVVQTVWLALLRNLGQLTQPRALAAWLITTTRREAQRARIVFDHTEGLPAEVIEALPTESGLPEPEAVRTDRDRRLWAAFRRLPQRCQELLRLTVLAQRAEYRAVAEALSMPHGSIGPTRGRCLTALRSLFGMEGGAL